MACKYMVFLPLFLVFLVHRIVFSPYFSSLKSRANFIWEKLMSCLRFRHLPSYFSRFASAPFDDPSHPNGHDPSSRSPSQSSSLRQVVIC